MEKKETVIAPFEYPGSVVGTGAAPEPSMWTSLAPPQSKEQAQLLAKIENLQAHEATLAQGVAQQVAAARAEAYEAARLEQQGQSARKAEAAREALASAVNAFAASRDQYFAQIEPEVVRLALAIATRILHRETQMDPLLLSGAVRVALGQLSDATEVRLRVPAAEIELWTEMIRLMPQLPLRPLVIPDDQLAAGACSLETHLGSVDLGVEAQLVEIERGFFDLLERRVLEHRIQVPHAAAG